MMILATTITPRKTPTTRTARRDMKRLKPILQVLVKIVDQHYLDTCQHLLLATEPAVW
jgi:hypothetical protein